MQLPDLAFFEQIGNAAAAETLPRFRAGAAVDNKVAGGFDPVTEADREAERVIRALISGAFPDHGILGEEHGVEGADKEYVWVIDPVDGTRAFIAGLPVWGTLVGLYRNGRAVMGMMDQPFTGERFVGTPEGAFLIRAGEKTPIRSRKGIALKDAILMTTTPALFKGPLEPVYQRLEQSVRLARYGCDCYAYAMVAAGNIDICVDAGIQSYDIAGLIPVIEQAGGCVTTFTGGRAEFGGDVIASGSPELHDEALRLIALS